MEDHEYIQEMLLRDIIEYGEFRKKDVSRGAETKELASLIVEKYGRGIAQAMRIIRMTGNIELDENKVINALDKLCLEIDPDWKENTKKRWAARSAGISYANPENVTSDDSGVYVPSEKK